jgi:hypothetical protein
MTRQYPLPQQTLADAIGPFQVVLARGNDPGLVERTEWLGLELLAVSRGANPDEPPGRTATQRKGEE